MNLKYTMETPKIMFKNSDHSYISREGERYTSVSTAFKQYKVPFDGPAISKKKILIDAFPKEYKALKKKFGFESPEVLNGLEALMPKDKLESMTNALMAKWAAKGERSRNIGTDMHKEIELYDLASGYKYSRMDGRKYPVINPEKQYDNQSLADDLFTLEDGYYPELLIFNEENKIAGQADGVFIKTVDGARYADVKDTKTDASINFMPDFRHPRSGYRKLLYDLNHLTECNINEYSVKMSMYMWMLSEFGFIPGKMLIENVKYDETEKLVNVKYYKVPYRKDEVLSMFC